MLPAYYEYSFPVKLLSGFTALDNMPAELNSANACRPLVVSDTGVQAAGLLKHVVNAFAETGITIGALFDQVPPESSTEVVNELAEIYRAKRCDCIIAVGGGSVIDTCKGVNILVSLGGNDIRGYQGAGTLNGPLRPFFVVPTTSGTGSEATNSAVIFDPVKNVKMLLSSEHLLPRAAVLDARMTLTLPPRLTAATGMDALTHAMESYICIQKNPMSDAYAWQAVRLIGRYLPAAAANPKDAGARLALANASTMAGTAFSNSMVGVVHSMGHATGSITHLPHGVVMNIFLPYGLEFNLPARPNEIGELLMPLAGAEVFASTPAGARAQRTIDEVYRLKDILHERTGLPRTLKEAGVSRSDFNAIAGLAINDATAIMNPLEITPEAALHILERAYDL